jgi:hypothetical protein
MNLHHKLESRPAAPLGCARDARRLGAELDAMSYIGQRETSKLPERL